MTSRSFARRSTRVLLTGIASIAFVGSLALADTGNRAKSSGDHHRQHGAAPEIDPSLAAAGIVLLVGGTLVLTGRRRPATS
jgi:hypothetical protein